MVAAQAGATDVASALVAAGAETTAAAPDGRTARELAAESGNSDVLAALTQ